MNKKAISAFIIASTITTNLATNEAVVVNALEKKDKNVDKNLKQRTTEETPILNGIKVNKQLININYSKGVTIVPKYIVIHDTDNRAFGANAKANRDYFANHPEALASAHYTVDQNNIIQALENTWRGWHVGDGNNKEINNSTTIAIELCVNPDNDFNKTLENGIALTKYLMTKYHISADHVVRHYDASGKICPKMMIKDKPQLWTYFKNTIKTFEMTNPNGINGSEESLKQVATGKIINVATRLNIREEANGNCKIVSSVNANSYVEIYGETSGWYKISYMESGIKKYGFISKNYVKITSGSTSEQNNTNTAKPDTKPNLNKDANIVNVQTNLNVRSAASKSSLVVGYLKNNDTVKVNYEENGWYNISFAGNRTGFVKSEFVKIADEKTNSNSQAETQNSNNKVNTNNNSTGKQKGRVYNISTNLNIRQGAGINYSVIAYALNDSELDILEENGDWYKVNYNDKVGYASKTYIKKLSEEKSEPKESAKEESYKEGVVVDVSTNLNVRTGPGIKNLVMSYLLPNTHVKVKGENNGWINIIFETNTGEKEGYVKSEYIKY